MIKQYVKLSLACAIAVVMLTSSSGNYVPETPNPNIFGQKFCDVIKKRDSVAFISIFKIDTSFVGFLTKVIKNDELIKADKKEQLFAYFKSDEMTSSYESLKISLGKVYKNANAFLINNKIDISKMEYVRSYYTIKYESSDGLVPYVYRDKLCFKSDTNYFVFEIRNIMPVGNKWVFDDIDDMHFTNAFFEELPQTNNYEQDVVADTVAVAPDYQSVDSTTYITEQPQLTKEQIKIQKKIDKLKEEFDSYNK